MYSGGREVERTVVQHMEHPGSYSITIRFPSKFSNIQSETVQPHGKVNKYTEKLFPELLQ